MTICSFAFGPLFIEHSFPCWPSLLPLGLLKSLDYVKNVVDIPSVILAGLYLSKLKKTIVYFLVLSSEQP